MLVGTGGICHFELVLYCSCSCATVLLFIMEIQEITRMIIKLKKDKIPYLLKFVNK